MTLANTKTIFLSRAYQTANGCIEWTGGLDRNGYGIFYYKNKKFFAHRFAFGIEKIPKKMFVCHKCDNPKCINPKHLFLGTPRDNALDCVAKNRTNNHKGESHHRAKLCE